MSKGVCAVVGVGPGIGASLARRFAQDDYAVAMVSRSLSYSRKLEKELGPAARAYACDVMDPDEVQRTFAEIEKEMGAVDVLCYNAGSGVRGAFDEIDLAAFETSWKVNALGLVTSARAVLPGMRARGAGSIIVTSATAAYRGKVQTSAFAAAKAAQRSLAQSMARQLWPEGIHVALMNVDGIVDMPRARQAMSDKPDEFFINPEAIAATAASLHGQDRSGWSFEVEVRPFQEDW
ncbi:MAG: SDR family NAD(P)-dependent oxidoreductase [Novosphingobium sp.]|nr:SDR family NAD(P)-dependent oxidoreductase [Novosphingobium sp.]